MVRAAASRPTVAVPRQVAEGRGEPRAGGRDAVGLVDATARPRSADAVEVRVVHEQGDLHVEPAEAPVAIDDDGPTDVLLVQNRNDPATPHRGAELLREKFGDRGRLVSVDDSGHGAYVLGGNTCASDVTTRYLVDGEMPADDVFCP
jgi:hypothetical protein